MRIPQLSSVVRARPRKTSSRGRRNIRPILSVSPSDPTRTASAAIRPEVTFGHLDDRFVGCAAEGRHAGNAGMEVFQNQPAGVSSHQEIAAPCSQMEPRPFLGQRELPDRENTQEIVRRIGERQILGSEPTGFAHHRGRHEAPARYPVMLDFDSPAPAHDAQTRAPTPLARVAHGFIHRAQAARDGESHLSPRNQSGGAAVTRGTESPRPKSARPPPATSAICPGCS